MADNLFFIANERSIYTCLERGIWNDIESNHEIDPITSESVLHVHDDGSEHSATDIKVSQYVRLFESCHQHLEISKQPLTTFFLIEIDREKLCSGSDILRMRPVINLTETYYLKNIMVDVSLIRKIHVYDAYAQQALKKIIRGQFQFKVEVSPELFSQSRIKLETSKETKIEQKKSSPPPIYPSVPQSSIIMKKGDLLKSTMQTWVNTVNCVGVMGKGIALSFKKMFPEMYKDYANRCKKKSVCLGKPYLYNLGSGRKIINFPTKGHWRENSKIEPIKEGLKYLVDHIADWKITSIAIPPLGCGNGNLDWCVIQPMMLSILSSTGTPTEIYVPHSENSFSGKRKRTRTTLIESQFKKRKEEETLPKKSPNMASFF